MPKQNPYQKDIDIIIENIENFIEQCDKTKKAYFWQPPSSISGRKQFNSQHNYDLTEDFEVYRHKRSYHKAFLIHLKANLHLTCSCKHVYRYCHIYLNDKSINLTVLKHLNKILKEINILTSQFVKKYGLIEIHRSQKDLENEEANS